MGGTVRKSSPSSLRVGIEEGAFNHYMKSKIQKQFPEYRW